MFILVFQDRRCHIDVNMKPPLQEPLDMLQKQIKGNTLQLVLEGSIMYIFVGV